jgi:transposase
VFERLQACCWTSWARPNRPWPGFEAVLDDVPPIRTPTGRRRRRPGKVHGDKAYDHRRCRAYLRRRGIRPRIARRGIESSARLGRHRWTIERTGAWLGGFRRLRIRYERCSETPW